MMLWCSKDALKRPPDEAITVRRFSFQAFGKTFRRYYMAVTVRWSCPRNTSHSSEDTGLFSFSSPPSCKVIPIPDSMVASLFVASFSFDHRLLRLIVSWINLHTQYTMNAPTANPKTIFVNQSKVVCTSVWVWRKTRYIAAEESPDKENRKVIKMKLLVIFVFLWSF